MPDNKSEVTEKWSVLSDEELENEIAKSIAGTAWTSSSAHWQFVNRVYPTIQDMHLQKRVCETLLRIASNESFPEGDADLCSRAAYVSSKLKLPGSKEILRKMIEKVGNPSLITWPVYFHWLNDSVKELTIHEAEPFLVRQLEALPKNWLNFVKDPRNTQDPKVQQYWAYTSAYNALKVINKELAEIYGNNLGLFSQDSNEE